MAFDFRITMNRLIQFGRGFDGRDIAPDLSDPTFENGRHVGRNRIEGDAHAHSGQGINDGAGGFKLKAAVANINLNFCAGSKNIYYIEVASGETDVRNASSDARGGSDVDNFSDGGKWKTLGSAALRDVARSVGRVITI